MHAAASRHKDRQRARLAAMYAVSSSMWVVIPLAVLGFGAVVHANVDSVAVAVLTMYATLMVITALVVKLLSTLNNEYKRRVHGRYTRNEIRTPVEPVVILIALIALVAVTVWFHTSDACGIGAGMYVCG